MAILRSDYSVNDRYSGTRYRVVRATVVHLPKTSPWVPKSAGGNLHPDHLYLGKNGVSSHQKSLGSYVLLRLVYRSVLQGKLTSVFTNNIAVDDFANS